MERGASAFTTTPERWSSLLFLAGGVALVAYAVSLAVVGFTEILAPGLVFGGVGFATTFLGLLGLCSGFANRSPRLARAGGVFAALGATGFTLTFAVGLTRFVEVTPPAWVRAAQLLNIIPVVLGFPLVGIASLRIDSHPLPLGVFLFVPALSFAVNVARVAVLGRWTPSWAPFLLWSLQALAMLAIGYSLRGEFVQTERAKRSTGVV